MTSTPNDGRKPFDMLTLLAEFGLERGMPINHPNTVAEFLESAKADLTKAQEDPALLHGQRTQAMFEAMVVSFGAVSSTKDRRQWPILFRWELRCS